LSIFTASEMNVAVFAGLVRSRHGAFTDDPSVASVKGLDSTVDIYPRKTVGRREEERHIGIVPAGSVGWGVRGRKAHCCGVLSILMPLIRAGVLTLPALSRQVPNADCPAPSPSNVIAPVHESMPDKLSVPLKADRHVRVVPAVDVGDRRGGCGGGRPALYRWIPAVSLGFPGCPFYPSRNKRRSWFLQRNAERPGGSGYHTAAGLCPVSVYLISFTPAHPEVSTALRSTVTVVLFHPAAFDCGRWHGTAGGRIGSSGLHHYQRFPIVSHRAPRAGNGEPGSKVRSPVAGLIANA